MSINMCTLSGRCTRDAELRQTQGGSSVLTFGIAVDERKRNQQTGQWESTPMFFDLVVFGNRASAIAQYLTKGTLVSVQGHLRQSSWTTQDGSKRSKVEVVVDEIEFMSRQQGQQQPRQQQYPQAPQYQQQAPQQQYYPPQQGYQQPELYEESIPF